MTAAVILAAGAGSRLGGVPKALLVHRDQTFLARIVGLVRASGGGDCVVVVGAPFGDQVAAHARSLGDDVRVIVNPDPTRGMASSIALGFANLPPAPAALLWPVDHPFVALATLTALAAVSAEVARPVYGGRGGHPPLVRRAAWPRFATCDEAPGGARAVMATLSVVDVVVDDPGVVRDVDTPEDRQALA